MTRAFRSRSGWLSLLAGLLVAAALPPWGWWPLAFCGVALFEVALGAEPTRGQRARRGWLFAAGWLFPGLVWMWYLTAPGYIIATALFAGFHALAATLAPTGRWRVIGRPAARLLAEALRLVFPFGGVPIATLAIPQAGGPFLGLARVGGMLLLTWFVLQVGTMLGAAVAERRPSAPIIGAAVSAIVVVLLAAVAPTGSDTGRTLRVAAVQGGGQQGTRASNSSARHVISRHLAVTSTIEPGSVDLVLWPENVIDVVTFVGSAEQQEVAAEAARIGAPFAVGITEDVAPSEPGAPERFLNAQVIVTPDGQVTSRYEKVHRVPFGEYVPLRGLLESLGAPVDQVPKDAVAGTEPAILDLPDGTRIGTVISFEVFFGDRARDGLQHGAEVLINPTNGSSYIGTWLQTQQVASSRLRAVETGRWVVQAAPTGFTAFVSPDGDVIGRTKQTEQIVVTHEVTLRSGDTWYTALGDLPFELLAAGGLFATTLAARRRRVGSGSSDLEHHGGGTVVDQADPHLGAEPAGGHLGTE